MKNEKLYSKFHAYAKEIEKKDFQLIDALQMAGKLQPPMKGAYPYIPFHGVSNLYDLFINLVEYHQKRAYKKRLKPTLLDVGAGTGRIVTLAKFMGIDAKGIELNSDCVIEGRKLYGLSEKELMVKDAFELDREFLEQFDVIYTYMPIAEPGLMGKLHMHLYATAGIWTVLAEMLPQYYPVKLAKKLDDHWTNGLRGAYILAGNHNFF